jgi:hypothetical protein
MIMKAEGVLSETDIDAPADALISEWEEFVAYSEAREQAIKAQTRARR